ncbi:MAG: ABC transporter permease subunit [Candidatus Latescibacteria bacterium]|nr:ABC transporter permease subunit [Candidatus Latescibacterota bacterium]NIO56183.1 ABC transporter permease subunit [Candidatus Latescibacterota bacterium]
MNSLAYPLFILKNHRGFALFSVVVIAALQYLIIELMTTLNTDAFINTIFSQLPERFRLLVSENFIARMSAEGAAAFGFNHPIVLALLVINAINIPTRHIAGEIESGTMEWLLAHPMKRMRILGSLWISGGFLIFLIICGAWTGSFLALAATHHYTYETFVKMLQIGTNLWLLSVLVLSFSILISAFGKEGSRVGMRCAAVILIFYFLHFLGTLWKFLEAIKPFNIFTYYQPQKLMFDERSFWLHLCVLSVLIGLCLIISVKQFQRRDIPG